MRQTHGSVAECTGYHGHWYSTSRNGILQFLCASYNVNPPNLQNKCDGCMQTFSLCHVLIFPNGGLVIACHNDICDEIIHLAKQAFSPNCILSEPLVHLVCSIYEEEVPHIESSP